MQLYLVEYLRGTFKRILLASFFSLLIITINAQEIPDFDVHMISKVDHDTIHVFTVSEREKKINHQNNRMYFWFYHDALNRSQGAHFGRLLHGEYEKTLLTGEPMEKGYFVKGLKEGKWSKWYRNGHLKSVSTYRKSLLHGTYKEYSPTGKLRIRGVYKRNMKNGKFVLFETGEIQQEEKEGGSTQTLSKLAVSSRSFYYGSRWKSIYTYKDDVLDGRFIELDQNGNLFRKGKYSNGKLDGKLVEYKNGKRDKQTYRNGVRLEEVSGNEKKEDEKDAERMRRKLEKKEKKEGNSQDKDQAREPSKTRRKWRQNEPDEI